MKKILTAVFAASVLTLGTVAIAPGAEASSWGCPPRPC